MDYKYLYLIEVEGKQAGIVSASDSMEAMKIWYEEKNKKELKRNGFEFDPPRNFSVRQFEREDLVIRASE